MWRHIGGKNCDCISGGEIASTNTKRGRSKSLEVGSQVLIKVDGPRRPQHSPYEAPFKFLERTGHSFNLDVLGGLSPNRGTKLIKYVLGNGEELTAFERTMKMSRPSQHPIKMVPRGETPECASTNKEEVSKS